MALDDVLPFLRCPHCGGELWRDAGVVRCPRRHSFDVARHGYVNLRGPDAPATGGDDADMVAARAALLGGGHYDVLAEAVAETCAAVAGAAGCVVDVGAGTGFYLAGVVERLPGRAGLALDVSRHALRRAARAHPRIGAVGCDVWGPLPVRTGVSAAVLSIFAPRNAAETARILRPDGVYVVVTPTRRHLRELVDAIGMVDVDACKQERLDAQLGSRLVAGERRTIEATSALGHEALELLVAMGPTARHLSRAGIAERVAALPEPATVTLSFTLSVYRCP